MKHSLTILSLLLILAVAMPSAAQGGNPVTASVIFGSAILRDGPTTGSSVIAEAVQGDTLTLVGRTADSTWYMAALANGQTVWVASFAVTVNGDISQLPVTTPLSPEIIVPPGCEYFNIGPFYGTAGQSVVLMQGWEATTRDQVEDYVSNVLQVVYFDGRLISTYAAYASEIILNEASGTWQVFWRFDMGPVAIGEHRVEWTQMFNNRTLTDGLDANHDGAADVYGPNPVTYGCTVIIE